MRVCVVTMYGKEYLQLAALAIANMDMYCDKHEYDSRIIFVEENKWEYRKHEMFKTLFKEGVDLIFYKDIDAIFTNLSVPIEKFIDEEHDWYATKDFNEINCGVLIIKNTEWSQRLNDAILARKGVYENEQNAFNEMYRSSQVNDRVKLLKHPSINSYQYGLYPECKECVGKPERGDWAEGQFLLHVPALSLEKRLEVLKSVKIIE